VTFAATLTTLVAALHNDAMQSAVANVAAMWVVWWRVCNVAATLGRAALAMGCGTGKAGPAGRLCGSGRPSNRGRRHANSTGAATIAHRAPA